MAEDPAADHPIAALKTEIMGHRGASDSCFMVPRDNALVEVAGTTMGSFDHARFGLLTSRHGRWNHQQVISSRRIEQATCEQGVNPESGRRVFHQKCASTRADRSAPTCAF